MSFEFDDIVEQFAELEEDLVEDFKIVDYWTPGRILDHIRRLEARMAGFDLRVMQSGVSDDFKKQWRLFYERWAQFFLEHEGWFSRLSVGTVDEADKYEKALDRFALEFKKMGHNPGVDTSSQGDDDGVSRVTWSVVGAVSAVVGAVGLYFWASRGRY